MLIGTELSVQVIRAIAITGNFAWSPAKDRVTAGDQALDLYGYDVGAELRPSPWLDHRARTFTPFIGAGVGGRTYDYRNLGKVPARSTPRGLTLQPRQPKRAVDSDGT